MNNLLYDESSNNVVTHDVKDNFANSREQVVHKPVICEVCSYINDSGVEDYHSSVHMNLIVPHLYLGAATYNYYELKHFEIDTIVNTAVEQVKIYDEDNEFGYIKFSLGDRPTFNILSIMDNMVDTIHKIITDKKNVFVHCAMGISRSASVVIAYLIKYHKMSYNKAFAHVKSARDCINPNHGFVAQLKLYEQKFTL